jgi:hypothetical protein
MSEETKGSIRVTWWISDDTVKRLKHKAIEQNLSTSALADKWLKERLERKK